MRPESTLLELLEEAADTYGMPLGTGEKLRAAAARLRSEMERAAMYSENEAARVTLNVLRKVNGGPLDTRSEPGRGAESAGTLPSQHLPAEEKRR